MAFKCGIEVRNQAEAVASLGPPVTVKTLLDTAIHPMCFYRTIMGGVKLPFLNHTPITLQARKWLLLPISK